MKYQIEVTPANTMFKTHVWQSSNYFTKPEAEHYAKQLKKVRQSYNGKPKFYSSVKIKIV